MMLISLYVLAADLDTYASMAAVVLPPAGPVRVVVPADVIGARPDDLALGVRILDGAQIPVPYAIIRSSAGGGQERSELPLSTDALDQWNVEAAEAPVDALILATQGMDGPFYATISWFDGGRWLEAPRTLMYSEDLEEGRTVEVPHVAGPFRVRLEAVDGRKRLIDVTALRNAPDYVPFVEESVAVGPPLLREDGTARYVLSLAGERTVKALRFEIPANEGILERRVTVSTPEFSYGSAATIRRIRVGDTNVERVTINVDNVVGETLFVDVERNRETPLAIDEIDVLSEGAYLVVNDAGSGPHIVYLGGTELESSYDLSVALPELLRARSSPVAVLQGVEPNPNFVATPTREGVDDPGPDLALSRFRYQRAINGTGWSRLELGADVLAHARADLGDIRVVDATGRQVPFLLWNAGAEEVREVSSFERTEVGAQTRLRIPLSGDAPIARLELRTSKGVFLRRVNVLRDLGRSTIAVRSVDWNGPERGSVLSLDLNDRMGEAILVTLDNGDDGPIPIDSVAIATGVWELRAKLPDGGARLVYGAPGTSSPAYDLDLLRSTVRTMRPATATLGEEQQLEAPVPGLVDRGATVAGVGMLVLGLFGMLLRVLASVVLPAKEEPASDSRPAG